MHGRAATKLVCTIGPASEARIPELLEAGMSVARLNLAHGSSAEHAARVAAIRDAARVAGCEVAILADLPGPKVRLGPLAGGTVDLAAGAAFRLLGGADVTHEGDATGASTTHPGLASDLRPGDHIQLADGAVELVVTAVEGATVLTTVEHAGTLRSRVGVNVPAERLSLPALAEHDLELARLAVDTGIDLLGQSFVRTLRDVEDLRSVIGPGGPAIVAKIETRPAVDGFEAIAAAADGVMVARGDLGLELPFEDVPMVQKRLVAMARSMGRPVIVATQMLESMLTAARPTRAEASDVANAVLDGADAVMLSGETAIGTFPVLAARAALRIAASAEAGAPPLLSGADAGGVGAGSRAQVSLAIAAAALAASDDEVTVLVAAGRTPAGAVAAAAQRPGVPILAVVPNARVARVLLVVRGVWPVVPSDPASAADPGAVSAAALLRDPAVLAMLPERGRAVVVAGADGGGAERIEVLAVRAAPGP